MSELVLAMVAKPVRSLAGLMALGALFAGAVMAFVLWALADDEELAR
jgi:hypothetical protein